MNLQLRRMIAEPDRNKRAQLAALVQADIECVSRRYLELAERRAKSEAAKRAAGFGTCGLCGCDLPLTRKQCDECRLRVKADAQRLTRAQQRKSRAKPPKQCVCSLCSASFLSPRKDRHFCSEECQLARRRALEQARKQSLDADGIARRRARKVLEAGKRRAARGLALEGAQ